MRFFTFLILLLLSAVVRAGQFPFFQNFDTVQVPRLPDGWSTTTNRLAAGDFATTTSSPYSDSNAVLSTNSTISQSLITPALDFSGREPDSIFFYERRSSSHTSAVLLEASVDGGSSYSFLISDSMKNPGTTSYVERKFKLPSSLGRQREVQFRWRILGNGSGTTGTYRLDDIKITARARFDASLSGLRFLPPFPAEGDTVAAIATVRNAGTFAIQNLRVSFYLDENGDSLPQIGELLSTTSNTVPLNPSDTVSATAQLVDVEFGTLPIIASVEADSDQDGSNDIRRAILTVGLKKHSVVISEIMYAPPAGEPEWLELYNTMTNPAELKNWKVSNRNSTTRYIVSALPAELEPQEFLVVTKDSITFRNAHTSFNGKLLQVTALPTSLFNNNGDAVVLFDARGGIMDSMHYLPTWGGTGGKSLERIEPDGLSTDSTNWGTSEDSSGSSPGAQNYLTPLEHNLRLNRLSTFNGMGSTLLDVIVQNIGRQPESGYSISLYRDLNNDSLPEPEELLQTQSSLFTIVPKESIRIEFKWDNPPCGEEEVFVQLNDSDDMRLCDNFLKKSISFPFPTRTLVINEIMYDPLKNGAEYVELLNLSRSPIDVCRWKLGDRRDTSQSSAVTALTSDHRLLHENCFLVVASDSSIFDRFPYLRDTLSFSVIIRHAALSLNNTGDDVILSDLTNLTIDSVHYNPSWNNPDIDDPSGRSLERINPKFGSNDARNWSTSADPLGGTPGRQNSIYTIAIPSTAAVSCSPNPFSPDGDGRDDFTVIHYVLPGTTAAIRIRIFDAAGRLIRTLADGEPSGAHGDVPWNGYADSGNRARMGIYIVLIDAVDARGRPLSTAKCTVVVAVKL